MIVTRAGRSYEVVDDPVHHDGDWHFWQNQFPEQWEEGTRQVIERFVDGGVYVDIGAWVGPTVLWGAEKARNVVACEPDPEAFRQLKANVLLNYDNTVLLPYAVADRHGVVDLNQRTGWGDSMSSLVDTGGPSTEVQSCTLEWLIERYTAGPVDLIKMDIEGGESVVLRQAEPFLRELGAPLLLAVHPQWWPFDPLPLLRDNGWSIQPLDQWQAVCTP